MIRVWSWRLVCSTVQTASRITWQNTPDRCRPAGVHQSGIMYYILILRLVCLHPPCYNGVIWYFLGSMVFVVHFNPAL